MTRARISAMASGIGFCIAVCLVISAPVTAQTTRVQKEIAKGKRKYSRETNPVKRAKEVVNLGRAEYLAARQCINAGKTSAALEFFKEYNEQAISAHDALDIAGINAVKHSNGFRQLQISVRESAGQLRDITNHLPFEEQAPFQVLRKSLDALNQKLISELFATLPRNQFGRRKKHP